MPLFQSTVVAKYLKSLDASVVDNKWKLFTDHFHNTQIQENIRNSKEEQYQEGFLRDLFVKVLGYTLNPENNFNLTTEYKNVKDSKKADGAIILGDKVKAVIELKGTETTDLTKVETQAFGYKNNQPDCTYIIASNFEKLRFYIDNAIEHMEFNLFTLTKQEFQLMYLSLAYENLEKDIPKKIKEESVSQEDAITKKLYNDYSLFKRELHQSLVVLNPQYDALTLFQKSQKLLDRFLFLFFAEDRQLLPPNSVRLILEQWIKLKDLDAYIPLFDRFKKYFGYLNTGFKGKQYDVYAYNGGLFKTDTVLDAIVIDDDLLYKHALKLSEYDFNSEVDVNILGHIFENSLNEIEEIQAQLEGQYIDRSKSKRKKDGVFYTPKYITKYIVENTVGKLCEEKKVELEIIEEEYTTDKKRQQKTRKTLLDKLTAYRNWLLQITICDPACGSGAFLNQALDFLIKEHRYIDELQAKLFGDAMVLSDVEKSILENNLFGVDINEESVEIAKLSLWLRTAQPNRKLNDLSNNIKCGNSLIDDPSVAGDKAFNWQQEFPHIFPPSKGDKGDVKGGFDVVIGNPPYKAGRHWSEKDSELHSYLTKTYITADYQLDLYVLFFERSLNLLKKEVGLLSFIAPNTWFTNISSKGMREYFLTNSEITQILDCSKEDVFVDAVVETAIVTMKSKKTKSNNIEIFQLRGTQIVPIHNIERKNWLMDENFYMNIFVTEVEQKIKSKIERVGKPLGDLCEVKFGVKFYQVGKGKPKQTKDIGTNRVFESDKKLTDDYYKVLEGKDIMRYYINWQDRWIKYGEHLAEPRNIELFQNQRLLVRRIMGERIIACWIEETMISNALLHVVKVPNLYSAKVILGIVCSKLMAFYFRKSSGREDKAFPEIKVHQLRSLPIITSSESIKMEPYIDRLVHVTNEKYKLHNKFLNFVQSQFIAKPTKKIKNWHELSFGEFISELKQIINKENGTILTKIDEMDWMDIFETKKAEFQTLKSEIDNKDKEIDQMVYELYGLTEEEIKIVEQS